MDIPEEIMCRIIVESGVFPCVLLNKTLYQVFQSDWYQLLMHHNSMYQTSYLCYKVMRGSYCISFSDVNTCPRHIYQRIRYIQNPR